jgi:flavodoxin
MKEKLELGIYAEVLNTLIGNANFSNLSGILVRTNAVIAGGSVVMPYTTDYYSVSINDLDIYVNAENAYELFLELQGEFGYQIGEEIGDGVFLAPAYDESFFRKNGIAGRFRMYTAVRREDDSTLTMPPVDLIVISGEKTPIEVVSNFDLTFCETWYDGIDVWSNYKDDLLNLRGKLKPDYVDALLKNFNKFIQERIIKYTRRGFKIEIGDCSNRIIGSIRGQKNISSDEEWVVKFLYKILYSTRSTQFERVQFFLLNPMENYDKASLITVLEKTYTDRIRVMRRLVSEILSDILDSIINEKYKVMTLHFLQSDPEFEKYFNIARIISRLNETAEFAIDLDIETINLDDMIPNYPELYINFNEEGFGEKQVYDMVDFVDKNLSSFLDEDERNLIIVVPAEDVGGEDKFFCYNIDFFVNLFKTRGTSIFYDCVSRDGREINAKMPVVKLPYDVVNDRNAFVHIEDILKNVFQSGKRIFYLTPSWISPGNQEFFEYSISYAALNYMRFHNAYVSANHCQQGSLLLIYRLKVCEGNDCVISNASRMREYDITMNEDDKVPNVIIDKISGESIFDETEQIPREHEIMQNETQEALANDEYGEIPIPNQRQQEEQSRMREAFRRELDARNGIVREVPVTDRYRLNDEENSSSEEDSQDGSVESEERVHSQELSSDEEDGDFNPPWQFTGEEGDMYDLPPRPPNDNWRRNGN